MIRPSRTRPRPFEKLAQNSDDLAKLFQAERDAPPVLLNDWTHDLSETIYARYFETGAFPNCVDSILANGFGRVECLPDCVLQAGTGLGLSSLLSGGGESSQTSSEVSAMSMAGMNKRMDMAGSSMSMDMMPMTSTALMSSRTPPPSMSTDTTMEETSKTKSSMQMTTTSPMSSMTPQSSMASDSNMNSMSGEQATVSLDARGCTPPMMFKPGFNLSSLPPSTCAKTTSSLLTIPANYTQGWLALNLVNSGAVSKLAVSLDAHSMYVYAADGLYVTLHEVNVSRKPSDGHVRL